MFFIYTCCIHLSCGWSVIYSYTRSDCQSLNLYKAGESYHSQVRPVACNNVKRTTASQKHFHSISGYRERSASSNQHNHTDEIK